MVTLDIKYVCNQKETERGVIKMNKAIDVDRIIEQIQKKKIPISKIAEETGYSRVSIYRYLNKQRVPTIDFINKIVKLLG